MCIFFTSHFFYFSVLCTLSDTRLVSKKKAAFLWRLRKRSNPPILGVRKFLSYELIRRNERINLRILEMLIVVISKRATLLSARRTYIRLIFISVRHSYKCIYARRANLSRPDLSKCECTFPCFWSSLHDETSSLSRENCRKSESSTERSHAIDKKHTGARFILRKHERGLFLRQKYHRRVKIRLWKFPCLLMTSKSINVRISFSLFLFSFSGDW